MFIMGGDDDGRAEPVKFFKQMDQTQGHAVIDVAGRLIGQQ